MDRIRKDSLIAGFVPYAWVVNQTPVAGPGHGSGQKTDRSGNLCHYGHGGLYYLTLHAVRHLVQQRFERTVVFAEQIRQRDIVDAMMLLGMVGLPIAVQVDRCQLLLNQGGGGLLWL